VRYKRVLRAGLPLLIVLTTLAACYLSFPPMGGSTWFARDLDHNGQNEIYQLEKGQLTIREGKRLLWQSPRSWTIQSCLTADANNDGAEELLLVLWKKGSFGPSKPMWQEGKDDEYSNHLFLYRPVAGKLKSVWCSSALIHPIIKLEVTDINNDGKNELKVVEGPKAGTAYNLRRHFSQRSTSWVWEGWGFVRI
jgi:hypothetical protein